MDFSLSLITQCSLVRLDIAIVKHMQSLHFESTLELDVKEVSLVLLRVAKHIDVLVRDQLDANLIVISVVDFFNVTLEFQHIV
jgi:hypothetical protein